VRPLLTWNSRLHGRRIHEKLRVLPHLSSLAGACWPGAAQGEEADVQNQKDRTVHTGHVEKRLVSGSCSPACAAGAQCCPGCRLSSCYV
jgi:hypothetical protein